MGNSTILHFCDAIQDAVRQTGISLRRHSSTNNYCCQCRGTTRQNVDPCGESTCTVCGVRHYLIHARNPVMR
jgi:hypothetical protein